jgi:hypothetical protein
MTGNSLLHAFLGYAELARNNSAAAHAALSKALELYPGNVLANLGRALAERRAGQYEAALDSTIAVIARRGFREAGPLEIPEPNGIAEVRTALAHLSGNDALMWHDVYITFDTNGPGINLPLRLAEEYPREMTIQLIESSERLQVHDGSFSVAMLDARSERLNVPYSAITAFADHGVHLRLDGRAFGRDTATTPVSALSFLDALALSELGWNLIATGREGEGLAVLAEVVRFGRESAPASIPDAWAFDPMFRPEEVGWALIGIGAVTGASEALAHVSGSDRQNLRVPAGLAATAALRGQCGVAFEAIEADHVEPAWRMAWAALLARETACNATD